MGGDLGGAARDGPSKFEVGDGPCLHVRPSIFVISEILSTIINVRSISTVLLTGLRSEGLITVKQLLFHFSFPGKARSTI